MKKMQFSVDIKAPTTLTVEIDVPSGQEATFKTRLPKALKRVKTLTEEQK